MKELLRLFAEIALLRRGPQDVPASQLLLIVTVAGYVAVNLVFGMLLPPTSGSWVAQLAVDTAFTLAWYAILLRAVKRPERFLQTATAMFGFQMLLSPLWIASGWLLQHATAGGVAAASHPGQWPALIVALVLVVWMVAAGANIVKAALEWSMGASVGLVILQIFAGQFLLLALFATQG